MRTASRPNRPDLNEPGSTQFERPISRRSLLSEDFPIVEVSDESSREKSLRRGHISTLQLWWGRRPLAVSRAAVFAALCPPAETVESSPRLKELVAEMRHNGLGAPDNLRAVVGELAKWDSASNEAFLAKIREFLTEAVGRVPLVVDTFAGGGSIPVEALRLGLDVYAGELNPVAVLGLRAAVELLPGANPGVFVEFKRLTDQLEERMKRITADLYRTNAEGTPLAFHWCRTYRCPECGTTVPLLKDFWLARGRNRIAVGIRHSPFAKRFEFHLTFPATEAEKKAASLGTVCASGARCPNCLTGVKKTWLQVEGVGGRIGEQLYAICFLTAKGRKEYVAAGQDDEALASGCRLRPNVRRRLTSVPSEEFNLNGIRHTWAYQYGMKRTDDLYNNRQGVALLELFCELDQCKKRIMNSERLNNKTKSLYVLLLALLFNRMVMYGTRTSWWQSNGEFPANMFGRQAIPMVWNYVEIPITSPKAAGLGSGRDWILAAARHLASLPKSGRVELSDATRCRLGDCSADLIVIDPPYYDSIAYSYLSDVFYVWMREFLGRSPIEGFEGRLSPKDEEAIVDRPHKLAPSPKTDAHFRMKIRESLIEARRVLRNDGSLLIMFGHRSEKAWSALIESVFSAGFQLDASWPVRTERKVKFRHGKVAALSSSCLLLCTPTWKHEREKVSPEEFDRVLNRILRDKIRRYSALHIYGEDLVSSLLASSCSLLTAMEVQLPIGEILSVARLMEELPDRIAELDKQEALSELAKSCGIGESIPPQSIAQRLERDPEDEIARLAMDVVRLHKEATAEEFDTFINGVSASRLERVCLLLRVELRRGGRGLTVADPHEQVLERLGMRLRNQTG